MSEINPVIPKREYLHSHIFYSIENSHKMCYTYYVKNYWREDYV